ncbi:MAG: hypothetical protein U0R21_09400 [Nocardioidaceae bacterium]
MYNLIIGATSGTIGADRLFEHTDDASRASFSDVHGPDVARLMSVPALLMPEVQNHSGEPPVARLGRISALRRLGRDYHFTFTPSPHAGAIPLARVVELGPELGVSDAWEWNRTHWAVKDADLFEVAHEAAAPAKLVPTAFTFPTDQPREPDLVAVMMPFKGFDLVYDAIKAAVEDAGFQCLRADDIWDHEHIMSDVISLIWRAQVVVSDFTGRNANVFYETGIAHSLGRPVVPITQAMDDVPFDLQGIRAQHYLSNGEGLANLRAKLAAKLTSFR